MEGPKEKKLPAPRVKDGTPFDCLPAAPVSRIFGNRSALAAPTRAIAAAIPVVTLLAKPTEADVLAAADSGARVRLTLRNPLDDESKPRGPLSLDAVMQAR